MGCIPQVQINWVASDHACCLEELKQDELWTALPGFGGTALLYPLLISEGYHKRKLSLEQVADLAATNPARAYGLTPRRGAISVGADADLTIIDLEKEQPVSVELLHSGTGPHAVCRHARQGMAGADGAARRHRLQGWRDHRRTHRRIPLTSPFRASRAGDRLSMSGGALNGIRVLDLATIYAGPFSAMLLGDYGADVIKVEHPRGDPLRTHGYSKNGVGLWWKMLSRNKLTVSIDFSKSEGQELLRELVRTADVLIENFRPGVMEKWGLGYEDLSAINPRLVMLRTTGFGQNGPYSTRPGFGTLAESMSGFAYMTGQPDGPPTLPRSGSPTGSPGSPERSRRCSPSTTATQGAVRVR